jgi:hypothetical protein
MHRILSSMMAAIGRQLKQSMNVFHTLMLYLRLPARHQYLRVFRECVAPTLVIETVDTVYARVLVIAPEQEEVLGILDLVREEQADRLEALLTPVDVVSEEEVIRLWREAAVLEQPQQVVVLAMDVTWNWRSNEGLEEEGRKHMTRTTDFDGGFDLEEDRLFEEDLPRRGTYKLDLVLLQLHSLPRAVTSDWTADQTRHTARGRRGPGTHPRAGVR